MKPRSASDLSTDEHLKDLLPRPLKLHQSILEV